MRRRPRLSYANVAATLALFAAVSTGTVYAANEWTGANIVNDSLTGADISEASLGKVPNADTLDGINSPGFIQGARAGLFWEKSKGRAYLNRVDTIKGDAEVTILVVPYLLHFAASCGSFGAATQWSTDIISDVDGLQIFYEGLGYPASYTTIDATDGLVLSAHDVGRLTIQAGTGANARSGQRLVTIDMFGLPSGETCFHQFSALSQNE
jgi:hypothetical protein